MKNRFALALATALLLCAASAHAAMPTVTVIGKMIDRQCSVEDSFGLQPATEKRCTLTIQELTPGTTGYRTWTVYCPNKAADGQSVANNAFGFCSDPSGLQIRHPSHVYTISGWLRTEEQQKDGFGQVQGYQFQVQ